MPHDNWAILRFLSERANTQKGGVSLGERGVSLDMSFPVLFLAEMKPACQDKSSILFYSTHCIIVM